MSAKRVMIATPVKQEVAILHEFLGSLERLESGGASFSYLFFDDNSEELSSQLLRDFAASNERTRIRRLDDSGKAEYRRDEHTHYWSEHLIWRVARMKDEIISCAREEGYDALFLVDSDLLLRPRTLTHLLGLNLDIVSEVFWTRWKPDQPELPQVWVWDQYDLVPRHRGEQLTPEGEALLRDAFLDLLRVPGQYEVGGLGACTLISRRALEAGVAFREIRNLSLWGEDRHFCVRAAALGLRLHADTVMPPLHIYRASELQAVPQFLAACTEQGDVTTAAAT